MDRFDALRTFIAVADAGGFAAAASRLRRSPPAVTRIIAALEARVGARLLARTTRVVRLTEAGERFVVDARRIVAELEDAEASASSAHRGLRGAVRVTASVMFGHLHVAPIVLDFLAQHREINARVWFADRVVDLSEEGFDVAVRIAQLADSSLHAVRCGAVRTVVCASPGYLRKHPRLAHPAELSAHEAIGFHASLGEPNWTFEVDGRRLRAAPRFRMISNSTELGVSAALAGRGVVRSLSYMVAPHVRAGELVVVLEAYEPPPTPVQLVLLEGRQATARVRTFVEFAAERLRAVLRPDGPAGLPAARGLTPKRVRAQRP